MIKKNKKQQQQKNVDFIGIMKIHQGPLLLTWFNFNPSMYK